MTIQLLPSIREFIPEKNLTNVRSVGKPLSEAHTSLSIKGFTQERNLINVTNVGKHSTRLQTSFNIRGIILEKNDMNAIRMEELWERGHLM